MRKILLASRGTYVTDGKYDLFDKPRNEIKWAYIMTAGKSVPKVEYIKKHELRMRELGWDFEVLDIEGKTADQLRQALTGKEAINMLGGNSFFLIKCIRESGFREVLEEFLARDGVYCGSSAGSYVACPSMEMAAWKNPDKFDRYGVTDFTGMNLVSFLIFAHCTPEIISVIKPHIEQSKYDVKLLNDQQAIQIIDDRMDFLEDLSIESKDFGG